MSLYGEKRIEREQRIFEEIKKFGLKPLDFEEEFKSVKTLVKCENKEGYLVQTNLERLRTGKEPQPFFGPYAFVNAVKLAKRLNVTLLEDQKIEKKDGPLKAKYKGLDIEISIKEMENSTKIDPFDAKRSFGIKNMKMLVQSWDKSKERIKRDWSFVKVVRLMSEVEEYGYDILDVEDWNAQRTNFIARDRNGLKVRVSLDRLKRGKVPNAFKLNPYALENVSNLAQALNIKIPLDQEYRDFDSPLLGYKDGYKVNVRLREILSGSDVSPFHTNNPYAIENIQLMFDKLETGLRLLPNQAYQGTKQPLIATTKEGFKVFVRVFDIKNGKEPMPFRTGNEFTLENIDILMKNHGVKTELCPGQTYEGYDKYLAAKTEEGYKVMVTVDSIRNGSKLLPFHPSNPYTIENINTYCKNNRPDYRVKEDQEYINSKLKLKFKYIGTNFPTGINDEFDVTWDAFKSGVGHPMVGKGKRVR